MSIAPYLKEIARGAHGARPLTRAQAADLWDQLLDGTVSDVEVGAFCVAMRIKGETADEMAGFLDATHARLPVMATLAVANGVVVLPSYNGARKLPVLTPLLALVLAQRGLTVLLHGEATEERRVSSAQVLRELGADMDAPERAKTAIKNIANVALPGTLVACSTHALLPGLSRLLAVRRAIGLRSSAHSLVKLMNPCAATPAAGPALVVGCYTHPEYAESMAATWALTGQSGLLLRGTEGEPVADARRAPAIDGFWGGERHALLPAQEGPLTQLPDLPAMDAAAAYTLAVLRGERALPEPLAQQVAVIERAMTAIKALA